MVPLTLFTPYKTQYLHTVDFCCGGSPHIMDEGINVDKKQVNYSV